MQRWGKSENELTRRLNILRQRIDNAASRSGRRTDDIRLVAVTKTFPIQTAQAAIDAGLRDLGESRVQEAVPKIEAINDSRVRWHLIGHLQSNKVRLAVKNFDVIQTVDSHELVGRLDRVAGDLSRRLDLLVQVDLANEPNKSGATESEVDGIVAAIDEAPNLDLRGLMTLPPFFDSPEATRPYFSKLREIRDGLNLKRPANIRLTQLSMGMSHDFEVAIEEGATIVRVGTALFGARGSAA
jgi:pyridoxal phosphate enzyme (YggS family)